MSRALKENDVLELSKLYEAEFNQPELHDRVLIFDVVRNASWQPTIDTPNNEEIENEASNESKDEEIPTEANENETAENEIAAISPNTSDEAEVQTNGQQDCEIASTDEDGENNQRIENEVWSKVEDEDITSATEANENETTATEKPEMGQSTSNSDENETKGVKDCEIAEEASGQSPSFNTEPSENNNEIENHQPSVNANNDDTIRERRFYIHSSWLAVQSSYFRSLFYSGMKESSAKEIHVRISESEERSHLMLLRAMYEIDSLDNADVDELLQVLRLAHKYDVKFVFKKCKYCLIQAAKLSLEVCEKIMRFIKLENTNMTDVEDVASTLQSFLAEGFSPLDKTWQTESFTSLNEASLKYLLSSDELVAASENTVFHALVYWIEHRGNGGIDNVSESQGLISLLSVVRFEMIPIDYLYNIVQHNAVAKKLVDFDKHYLRGISYHALSDDIKRQLPRQPVKRKASTWYFTPYTWVIPRDELNKLIDNDKKLKSDAFWFCGYRMRLLIKYKGECLKKENVDSSFKLGLEIVNLTKKSVVKISWRPVSESFLEGGSVDHTFNNSTYSSVSLISIHRKIKTKSRPTSPPSLPTAFLNQAEGFYYGGVPVRARPAYETPGNSFGVKTLESSKPKFAEKASLTPSLSIDINMKLL